MRDARAPPPEVHVAEDERGGEHIVDDAGLPIELKRPRLDRERARRRARLCHGVHDAHADAQLGKEEREEQPGRPGADDEDLGGFIGHRSSIGLAGRGASPSRGWW